ncbi:g5679 [Coccomyxa viridis]|uniref:Formin-like protein n=1 Tax=Coccomyxa viridis TaxID=1274662 RepID=A0ABP1FW60_9CHLO
MENQAMKKLVKVRNEDILLIEHRRAHNICIELAGVRMPFPDIKEALWRMEDSRLSVEQLTALSRAVPEEQERRDIGLFLKGEHPKHRGVSEAGLLGTVERYFAEIMPIPRLQQRIDCFIFTRSFEPAMQRVRGQLEVLMSASEELMACGDFMILLRAVLTLGNHLNEGTMRGSASGFKLDTLLKLADVKGTDRKTSLLHFVLEQLLKEENASVGTLSAQLKSIHPAANLQVSAIKQGIAELRAGLKKAESEISMAADLVGADEGAALMAQFANMMAAFHTSAVAAVARTEEHEASVYGSMKSVTAYFGEDWDANDPSRVLRVIRDFMNLFNKAQHEIEAKKLKEEEERSKEQRKASLAASRRPSLSAPGGAPSAAGEAATPSGARKGSTLMSPEQGESEMQTPMSQMMPCPAQMGTPAESVGSVWVPDAVSVSRAPVRDNWPSNGFGRVLEEPQTQRSPRASLAEHALGSRHPCRLSSGNEAQDAALGSAGCADADVTLEVVASKEAAADACLAAAQDGNMRVANEASSAGEQRIPAKLGSPRQQEVQHAAAHEDQQSVESKHLQQPREPLDVRAAFAAGGRGSQGDSSAESSPCSSQQAYADAGSNAMFTPVPLVDRLPVGTRSSLRLEQLPCPSPLPASCPATPAGQRRQPLPEESTPVLFGRPASAGVGSARRAPYLEGSGWTPPPTVLVDSQRYFTPGFKRMFTPARSPSGSPSL